MKTIIHNALTSVLAIFMTLQAWALDPSAYKKSSVFGSGKWVRISVSAEGIHQITPAQLKEWGFSNPSKVKVYGYGATALSNSVFSTDIPDDAGPVCSMVTDDGRVLFYGVADVQVTPYVDSSNSQKYNFTVDRNMYATHGCYFITDDDAFEAAKPRTVAFNSAASPNVLDNHLALVFAEEEKNNPATSGASYLGTYYNPGSTMSFTANVRDYSYTSPYFGRAYFRSDVGATFKGTSGFYPFTAKYPGGFYVAESLRPMISGPGRPEQTARKATSYAILRGGTVNGSEYPIADGDYTFSFTVPEMANLNAAAFDRSYLIYPRQNRMSAAEPAMTMFVTQATANSNFSISNATATTCVWTIESPASVAVHSTSFDSATGVAKATFSRGYNTASAPARIVAFDPQATHLAVEYCGPVANQNLHALGTPDLLIITIPALLAEAENLAQMHRENDGIDVVVALQQQVFNEFSSGTPSAQAYRRMAKMFFDRNPQKFKNLLFYGVGSWDNRGVCIKSDGEQLLTYQAEFGTPKTSADGWDAAAYEYDSHVSFCSDAWFGMLDDNYTTDALLNRFNPMSIGVGRIPVTSPSDARQANAKILSVMQNPLTPEAFLNALMLSDVKEKEAHITQSEEIGDTLVSRNPCITVNRAHAYIFPRDRKNMVSYIKDKLDRGMGYFTFSGHGSTRALGNVYGLWNRTDVADQEYSRFPFAMLSTCDTYDFDRVPLNLATDMVLKNSGGMMGVIGAGRTVEMSRNQVLNRASAEVYSETRSKITMGELYRNIVNRANSRQLISQIQVTRANTLSYNLCGDPALVMNFPDSGVRFDVTVGDDDVCEVDPMSEFTVSGSVSADGLDIDTDFNGSATVTFYESPHVVLSRKENDKELDVDPYTLDENPLASVTVPVEQGKFAAKMVVPFATYTGSPNRVVVTAFNPLTGKAYAGMTKSYQLTDKTVEPSAVEGPAITELYLDSPEFCENDAVSSAPTVYATVNIGTAGICPNTTIGAGTKVVIDDVKTLTGAAYALHHNGDGTASMAFKVKNLAAGHHKITLSVADPLGNRDQRSISFVVNGRQDALALEADRLTARDCVEFCLSGTAPDAAATIIVSDSKGNPVMQQESVQLPFMWNLRTSGKRVADGVYHAHVRYPDAPFTIVDRCTFTVIE